MRDKSGTFLLWHPGYIALRTQLRTLGPDKDTWDTMADEVPCGLWQPLSIALTRGHMDVWNNNKTSRGTFAKHITLIYGKYPSVSWIENRFETGCTWNNLKKWETDEGNGRSWEKITSGLGQRFTGDEKMFLSNSTNLCLKTGTNEMFKRREKGVKGFYKKPRLFKQSWADAFCFSPAQLSVLVGGN